MNCGEFVSSISNIVIAVAAITTVVIAARGLKSWQDELRGKSEYDIVRRLLKATYLVRNAIDDCRSPFFPASEFPPDNTATEKEPHNEATMWAYIYNNRFNPLRDAMAEFEAATIEAEVLWGDTICKLTKSLTSCVFKLRCAVDKFIRFEKNRRKNGVGEIDEATNNILTDHVTAKSENEYTKELRIAITSIEDFLRPHLMRR